MISSIIFLLSFLLSCVFTALTIKFASRAGLIDDPKLRKHPASIHKKAVPRAGGLPIFAAFTAVIVLLLPFNIFGLGPYFQKVLGIILGGLILVVVGILDDKYDLRNSYKFWAQLLAAIVVVGSGVGITFITNPFQVFGDFPSTIRLDEWRVVFDFFGQHSIVVWADLFAIFWIVWVINMTNFSSGVDGQLGGISLVALFVIFAASLRFSGDPTQDVVKSLAMAGAGATLGFLIFNLFPAKIFPGDSGSYFLGYLIAVLAILAGARVGTAILVMAVPLIDGVFTVVRRIAAGKSPFLGDRKHLHHRLLEIGWSQRAIFLFYSLLCAILGAIALTLPQNEKLFAGVLAAIIILGGIVWLNIHLPTKVRK